MSNVSIKKILSKILTYNYMYGEIASFAGAAGNIPNGWEICDGKAVSRTKYIKLFNVIGTTYGEGDGSTTFNLPNLTNRFAVGSTVMSYPQGTNLLSDSTADAGQSHTTYNIYDFPFNAPLVEGQTYTIKAKINTSSEKTLIACCHTGGSIRLGDWVPVNEFGLYKIIFTATSAMASQTGSTYGYGYCRVYVSNNPRGAQSAVTVAGTANVEWISIEAGEQKITLNEKLGSANAIVPEHYHSIAAMTSGAMSANASHSHYTRQLTDTIQKGSKYPRPMGISHTSYSLSITASSTYINHNHTMPATYTQSTGTDVTNLNLPPYTQVFFIIYVGEEATA